MNQLKTCIVLLLFTFLSYTTHLNAQEKINTNMYLYGILEQSIIGKTVINYQILDPKTEMKIIKEFQENGVDAVSWNKMFLPNVQYSNDQINEILIKNKVSTVILIGSNTSNLSANKSKYL